MIIQSTCDSFKLELLQGVHDFSNDSFKIAFYTSDASLGSSTTAYTATGEVGGTGYVAGGYNLTRKTPVLSSGVAITSFENLTVATDIKPRGALIYNASKSNKSVMVLDFGFDQNQIGSTLPIRFPDFTASSAILRIA